MPVSRDFRMTGRRQSRNSASSSPRCRRHRTLAEALDRSVLEAKGVSELREIARTLELRVSGLKKSQIIDLIAQAGNGSGAGRAQPDRRTNAQEPVAVGQNREFPEAQTLTEVPRDDGSRGDASSPVREVAPPMPVSA